MKMFIKVFNLCFVVFISITMTMLINPTGAYCKTKETVYFSAITLYHPIVMYQKYQPMMDYLTANTSYKFELKLNKDYQKVIDYLESGDVHLALLGGTTYIKAKEKVKVVPILKPKNAIGDVYYRSTIVVGKNSTISQIDDLKGKNVVFPSELSTSGFLLPVYSLMKKGVTLQSLSSYTNLRYHDSVAREVLKGNYDAGALIDAVASRYSKEGLKIIWYSEPIPGLPIVVRENTDPVFIKEVKDALLKLDYKKTEDRLTMDTWDDELKFGFAEASDSDYDIIELMMEELKKNGYLFY